MQKFQRFFHAVLAAFLLVGSFGLVVPSIASPAYAAELSREDALPDEIQMIAPRASWLGLSGPLEALSAFSHRLQCLVFGVLSTFQLGHLLSLRIQSPIIGLV